MTRIPTKEEFDRADRLDEERWRNLDEVRSTVIRRFERVCPLANFHLLPQRDVNFRAYVFFIRTEDIQKCKDIGINKKIEEFVYEELERVGRGMKTEITVAFEFDSEENVDSNYEGDYLLRLR